jgi:carboxyl-terminal processing protease
MGVAFGKVRFAVVLLALLGSGCVAATAPDEDAGGGTFSPDLVERTLASGLSRIVDRTLEPTTARQLALEGLRGLSGLDPQLAVAALESEVVLAMDDREGLRLTAPSDMDATGWAALVARVTREARRHSPEIRAADSEKLLETLFDAALASLDDPFSRYAGAEEASKNRDKREGFGGIGVQFRILNGEVRVSQIIPNTPAANAGIRVGDRITHVGEVPLRDLGEKAVTQQLHGRVGSRVRLRLEREGEPRPLELTMNRAHVTLPTVSAQAQWGVAFLAISGFNQDTLDSVIREIDSLKRLNRGRLRGAVLDLRGNPGGLLSEAIAVADLFLARGGIVSTKGRHKESFQHYEADDDDILAGAPLVVLIDGKTASAAEVLAAALQDRGRAAVVGTVSFGKGTVQTVLRLANDGEVTLTWSRLVTPGGHVFHRLGVLPSLCLSGRSGDAKAVLTESLVRADMAAAREDAKGGSARQICPPEERHGLLDREVALRLVGEPGILARALDAARGRDIARNPPPAH